MGPIRGQTRPLPVAAGIVPEAQQIDTEINASIHNRFDVEVIDARNGEVRQRAQAENVICAGLWNVYTTAWNNYIVYGSGSGTPSSADTALFKYVGGASATNASSVYANSVYAYKQKIKLDETTAVGVSLTEVGIATAQSGKTLCTHAMLQDANGNQISITKTATDIVNIYATVFVHLSADFKTWFGAPFKDSGDPPMLLGFAGKGIAVGSFTWGSSVETPGSMNYNASTKTITLTAGRLGADAGNSGGGIRSFSVHQNDNYNYWATLYCLGSSAFGSDIKGESVGTGDGSTADYKTAFGVVSHPTIYVNGIADASATVDAGVLHSATDWPFIPINGSGDIIFQIMRSYGAAEIWPKYYYNPLHETCGVKYITNSTDTSYGMLGVYVSDDLQSWVEISNGMRGQLEIPVAYRKYKYFKFTIATASTYSPNFTPTMDCKDTNIHFATAPASGAVITADYHTAVIAKDANHVYDITVTIQLGEHTA